jgi:hypothetical protein
MREGGGNLLGLPEMAGPPAAPCHYQSDGEVAGPERKRGKDRVQVRPGKDCPGSCSEYGIEKWICSKIQRLPVFLRSAVILPFIQRAVPPAPTLNVQNAVTQAKGMIPSRLSISKLRAIVPAWLKSRRICS